MGVHVILDIDPHGIDPAAWAIAYEETVKLLTRWRPRLLGWGDRSLHGANSVGTSSLSGSPARVPVYTRSIVFDEASPTEACWRVVGDRESLQTAECQSIHRDFSRYSSRGDRGAEVVSDIVVAAAAPERDHTGGPVRVFGDKTQGYPYHLAMLAAAMIIEDHFPRSAMVWGDIDREQSEEANRLAAPILGRDLALPVRVDAPRLIERLRAHYRDEECAGAFHRVFLSRSSSAHEAMLRAFPGEVGERPWRRSLAGHRSPTSLGAIRLLIDWLNAGRDLGEACQYACLSPEGPRHAPEELVDALASTWLTIPMSSRASLEALQRPRGAPHSVNSLIGGMFLDMRASGRHLRIEMEPREVEATFSRVFGDRAPALCARLRDRSPRSATGDTAYWPLAAAVLPE